MAELIDVYDAVTGEKHPHAVPATWLEEGHPFAERFSTDKPNANDKRHAVAALTKES